MTAFLKDPLFVAEYELRGIVEHTGDSLHHGHYTAAIRHAKGYTLFDDGQVHSVDFKKVKLYLGRVERAIHRIQCWKAMAAFWNIPQVTGGIVFLTEVAQVVAHLENFRCRWAIPEMPLRYSPPQDLFNPREEALAKMDNEVCTRTHIQSMQLLQHWTQVKRKCSWEGLAQVSGDFSKAELDLTPEDSRVLRESLPSTDSNAFNPEIRQICPDFDNFRIILKEW